MAKRSEDIFETLGIKPDASYDEANAAFKNYAEKIEKKYYGTNKQIRNEDDKRDFEKLREVEKTLGFRIGKENQREIYEKRRDAYNKFREENAKFKENIKDFKRKKDILEVRKGKDISQPSFSKPVTGPAIDSQSAIPFAQKGEQPIVEPETTPEAFLGKDMLEGQTGGQIYNQPSKNPVSGPEISAEGPIPFDKLPDPEPPLPFDNLALPFDDLGESSQGPSDDVSFAPAIPPPSTGGVASGIGNIVASQAKKKVVSIAAKSTAGKAAQKAVTSAITKTAAKKVGQEAAKKAAEAAVAAATGGASLAAEIGIAAGMFALGKAKEIGKGIALAVVTLPGMLSAGVSAATAGSLVNAAIAMAITPLIIGVFIIIINTGAYVVPNDEGFLFQDESSTAAVGCLNFAGPWPQTALNTELEAVGRIRQYTTYFKDLCESGPVKIVYNPVASGYGGFVSGGFVTIYQLGTGSLGNTLYTLAHELGHIYAGRYPTTMNLYRDTAFAREGQVCTYPYSNSYSESFAESIALFIGGKNPPAGFAVGSSGISRIQSCFSPGTFKTKMPQTWNFNQKEIFKTTLGW